MKIPKLALDYAKRFNLNPVFVQGVARQLREEGLLSQGARGVNAPEALPLDAARMLFPFMVGGIAMKAKDAPQIVRDFGRLKHVKTFKFDEELQRDVAIKGEEATPPGPLLEDAIAYIIDAMNDQDRMRELLPENPYDFGQGLIIQDGRLSAKIVHNHFTFLYRPETAFGHEEIETDNATPMAWLPERYRSSMHSERQMDFLQFAAISDVLSGRKPIGWYTLQSELGDTQ